MSDISGAATALQGKTVIVTGGARGLGAAICETLGEAGARLVIADTNAELAEQQTATLTRRGVQATWVPLDVGDEAQVRQAIAQTRERFGRLDVLVNNAAIDFTVPIGALSVSDWERAVRTNLTGPFVMAKYAVEAMGSRVAQGGSAGHIVNIASTASKRAWPNAAAYHATKWGLLGLSHALHAELRPLGIKVTAVVAGGMRTPFLLDRFPDIDTKLLQDPKNVAQAVKFALLQPDETVIPELMVIPMRETSWP
jgi:NAD(P)-dependent dehydrogenase (short-subunit alcohol dehydrogenase family)